MAAIRLINRVGPGCYNGPSAPALSSSRLPLEAARPSAAPASTSGCIPAKALLHSSDMFEVPARFPPISASIHTQNSICGVMSRRCLGSARLTRAGRVPCKDEQVDGTQVPRPIAGLVNVAVSPRLGA